MEQLLFHILCLFFLGVSTIYHRIVVATGRRPNYANYPNRKISAIETETEIAENTKQKAAPSNENARSLIANAFVAN